MKTRTFVVENHVRNGKVFSKPVAFSESRGLWTTATGDWGYRDGDGGYVGTVVEGSEKVGLVRRWEKCIVELPDWCTVVDYLDKFQKVRWLVAIGWPDTLDARPFFNLPDRQLAMLVWLFKANTTRTSVFWMDMRHQVKEWAKGSFYPTPLSDKQWKFLDGEHIDEIMGKAL